jgi:hypothetical protein
MQACSEDPAEILAVDRQALFEGLLFLNQDQANTEINKLTVDLEPKRDIHRANLDNLSQRLGVIQGLIVTETCYACIYSLPPQSEIRLLVDSLGTMVFRTVDVLTADDQALSSIRVHR